MSKPDDISQEAWDAGNECAASTQMPGGEGHSILREEIARAIMAATLAERGAILQFEFDLPLYASGVDMLIAIREYIRKRGEA